MDVSYLVTLPAMYTDLQTGALVEPAELTDEQWTTLGQGHSELGRVLLEQYGVRQMFHRHADAHVDGNATIDRFLELTDPTTVSLCLDTGHVAYVGGDNRAIVARHPDRVGYVHLKSIDPTVLAKVRAEGMSFAQAVQAGAMVGPARGEPEMPPLLADLDALGVPRRSTSAWLAARASEVNRGRVARTSPSPNVVVWSMRPVRKPRPSGLNGTSPMPSSCRVEMISGSGSRQNTEYSWCARLPRTSRSGGPSRPRRDP
jgi:Xylose isomerase-like TIM barrel